MISMIDPSVRMFVRHKFQIPWVSYSEHLQETIGKMTTLTKFS